MNKYRLIINLYEKVSKEHFCRSIEECICVAFRDDDMISFHIYDVESKKEVYNYEECLSLGIFE